MYIKYIEKKYYDEFLELLEEMCPYQLMVVTDVNTIFFNKKLFYMNCSNTEEIEHFCRDYILSYYNFNSYYEKIVNFKDRICCIEEENFSQLESRSLALNESIQKLDSNALFIQIIEDFEDWDNAIEEEDICEALISLCRDILLFKANSKFFYSIVRTKELDFYAYKELNAKNLETVLRAWVMLC